MNRKILLTVLVIVLGLLLVACGGGGGETAAPSGGGGDSSVGDAANGEKLYTQTVIGPNSAPGCVTCHSLQPDTVLTGPSHAGLASRAGSYQEGMSAEEYLRESIVDPDAHIVEGFTAGVMYQNFGDDLKASEINDLVAYMLTLN